MNRVPNDIAMLQRRSKSIMTPEQTLSQVRAGGFTPFEDALLKATKRQATFLMQAFTTVPNEPQLIRQREDRTYFLMQNTGANTLFIGFDFQPSSLVGLNLASGAFAEPFQVPTNDIWVMSTLATTGILIYSIGN